MFSQMKEHQQRFYRLNDLKTRIEDNKKRKQEVLTKVGDIYNKLYKIYKDKYNKKIDTLSAEHKKLLYYKRLRLSDNYLYSSGEEEEEEKQEEKTINLNKFNESIIKEGIDIKNMELFKNYFYYQTPSALLKDLYKTND